MPTSKKKKELKFTFRRTQEDIKNINKIRNHLRSESIFSNNIFKNDSEIYKKLPELYLKNIKIISELKLIIDELKLKLHRYQDVKNCFSRIMEIINEEREEEDGSG